MRIWTLFMILTFAAGPLAACDKFSIDPRGQKSPAATQTEPEASKTISANSGLAESLVGEGAISGAQATFNPGVLAIDTSVEIAEGVSIVDDTESELGLEAGSVTQQGTPVVVDADTDVDPVGSLVISLPLPGAQNLALQQGGYLAVLYKIEIKALGIFYSGILPTEFITVDATSGTATFEFSNFGLFQTVYMKEPVTEKKQVETTKRFQKRDPEPELPPEQPTEDPPVDDTPPGKFSIIAPAAMIKQSKPTISWSKAEDAIFYTVSIDDSSGCSSPLEQSKDLTRTSYAVATALSDATRYYVCVEAKDAAGNVTLATNNNYSFAIDMTAPAVPVVTGSAALTSDSTPDWSWESGGGGNGTFRYKLGDNGFATGATISEATTFTPKAALSDGVHTLYVQERDGVGNWSGIGSYAIEIDTSAPTANSISIRAGAVYTSQTAETLTLSSTGASEMYITNTAGCTSGGTWEPYATTKPWGLASTNQTTSVFARFRDAVGNVSPCISDSIIHDSSSPGAFSISAIGYVTTDEVTIGWSGASDSAAVTYRLTVGTSTSCGNEIADITGLSATTRTIGDLTAGAYYVCVTAQDAAGNTTSATNPDTPFKVLCDSFDPCTIASSKEVSASAAVTGSDLVISSGGILHGSSFSVTMTGMLTIDGEIHGNVVLSADELNISGLVTANGEGFAGGAGDSPGSHGSSAGGGGGAHGGNGGDSSAGTPGGTSPYGSLTAPVTKGSGGGSGSSSGGLGGGTVQLMATTSLSIDGDVTANGLPPGSGEGGGGAGGSIWINSSAATLTGTGSLSVLGGQGGVNSSKGGGGGGGRIAIYAQTKFSGDILVRGGHGGDATAERGEHGSFYQSVPSICDTGSLSTTCTISTVTPLGAETIAGAGDIVIDGGGNLYAVNPMAGFSIDIDGSFTVNAGATFVPSGVLVPESQSLAKLAADSIVINGALQGNLPLLFGKSSITINTGGSVSADGYGYAGVPSADGRGPLGGAQGTSGGGGGSAGAGGASEASAAGGGGSAPALTPNAFGSAGGASSDDRGGNGGGHIRLLSLGDLVLDGDLSADGANGAGLFGSGGGGGGSIWIDVMGFSGNGTLGANGGDGIGPSSSGGGGGGGMIAIYAGDGNVFAGSINATGGTSVAGAAGGDGSSNTSSFGDYQKVFVTSTQYAGAVSGSICASAASGGGLPGSWSALYSTSLANATLLVSSAPVFNLMGEIVVSSGNDLWVGALQHPISYDQMLFARDVLVWTGSDNAGVADDGNHCGDFNEVTDAFTGAVGRSSQTTSDWVNEPTGPLFCDQTAHVYCISQ